MNFRNLTIPLILVTGLALTSCSGTNNEQELSPPKQDSSTESPGSSLETSTERDVVADPPAKNIDEALQAGMEVFPGSVSQIKLSADRSGQLLYRLELFTATEEADVHLNADSLDTEKLEIEPLEADDRREALDLSALISIEEAAQIARAEQPGIITQWELEFNDNGIFEFEFEVSDEGNEIDVVVDAKTGTIIEIDR